MPTAQLDQYLDRRLVEDEEVRHLAKQWQVGGRREPLIIPDFLRPDVAGRLAGILAAAPIWDRVAYVYDGPDAQAEVEPAGWEQRPDRMSRQWLGRGLTRYLADTAKDNPELIGFIHLAVTSGVLRGWTSRVLGVPLKRLGSLELAAYGRGDEIKRHHDRVGTKTAVLNIYLDPQYRRTDGGRTVLERGDGATTDIFPDYNTAVLMPIGPDLHHWVCPWEADRRGRYTLNMGQDKES